MTEAELTMLDACCAELEKTRSDTIREAIMQMYMYLQATAQDED